MKAKKSGRGAAAPAATERVVLHLRPAMRDRWLRWWRSDRGLDSQLAALELYPTDGQRWAYRGALAAVLHSMLSGDFAPHELRKSWQSLDRQSCLKYIAGTTVIEANRILRDGEPAGPTDIEAYEFVRARPRGQERAPAWWESLLAEWRHAHPGSAIATTRALQEVARRGRRAKLELPLDDERAVAELEARESVRRAAREVLERLVEEVGGLPPTMRESYAAELRGEPVSRSRRQDLVGRLREAGAKKI